MVELQWNILYWRSKWIFHVVFWSVLGCDWGTTSVYFGIAYVCFKPSRIPVFGVCPNTNIYSFYFCQKYQLKDTHILKNPCRYKTWKGVCRTNIDQIGNYFHLRFSVVAIWCTLGSHFCNHAGGHPVTTEACTCQGLCSMEVWKFTCAICAMIRYNDYINA